MPNDLRNVLDLAKSNIVASVFDILGINYSIIDSFGVYIVQNSVAVSNISFGLTHALDIDPETWVDCQNVMNSRERKITEEAFKGKYYISIKQPLIDQGECLGILIVSFDITDRKKAEEALKEALERAQASDKAKSEFLQNMSHDFRNPLSGIIYSAQALMIAPEQAQEFAPMIQLSAEKLLDLCNGVLELISAEGVNESDVNAKPLISEK